MRNRQEFFITAILLGPYIFRVAHSKCNLRAGTKNVPVFLFHNFSAYDADFILKQLRQRIKEKHCAIARSDESFFPSALKLLLRICLKLGQLAKLREPLKFLHIHPVLSQNLEPLGLIFEVSSSFCLSFLISCLSKQRRKCHRLQLYQQIQKIQGITSQLMWLSEKQSHWVN